MCRHLTNPTHMENKQIGTVSILCPAPFFQSSTGDGQRTRPDNRNFSLSVFEHGRSRRSYSATLRPERAVSVNEGQCRMWNRDRTLCKGSGHESESLNYITGEYIALDYSLQTAISSRSRPSEDTRPRHFFREGVESNLFNYIGSGTTWLQLEPGENEFVYSGRRQLRDAFGDDITEIYLRGFNSWKCSQLWQMPHFKKLAVIDDYISFIWTSRFYAVGDFELCVPGKIRINHATELLHFSDRR